MPFCLIIRLAAGLEYRNVKALHNLRCQNNARSQVIFLPYCKEEASYLHLCFSKRARWNNVAITSFVVELKGVKRLLMYEYVLEFNLSAA